MKTLILIIQRKSSKIKLETIKAEIKAYVGTRMMENDQPEEDSPSMYLNCALDTKDKKVLSDKFDMKEIAFVFIEDPDDEMDKSISYINAEIKDSSIL